MDPYTETPAGLDEPDYQSFDQFQPPSPLFTEAPSHAETMHLQEIRASRAKVDRDLWTGEISEEVARSVREQLAMQEEPLVKKQQLFERLAKQKARQEITDEMAFGQSVKRRNMAHDAEGFHEAVSSFVDPMTGDHAFFFQPEPGKFEQMTLAPVTGAEGMGTEDIPSEGNPESSAESAPEVQKNSDGTQRMTIMNGQNRTEATFGPDGRLISQQQFGPDGQPAGQTGNPFDLPNQQMQYLRQQAWIASGGDPVAFRRIMPQLVQKAGAMHIQQQRQQAVAAEQQRREQAADTAKQKAAVAAEERQWRRDAIADVNKEFTEARKAHAKDPEQKMPAYLATPEARAAEAKRRFDETMAGMRDDSPQATERKESKEAGAKRAEADPLTPTQHLERGDEWTPETGWVNKRAEKAAPVRMEAVVQVINASELPAADKTAGMGAADTIKTVVSKYGSLDKAPEAERKAAQEAAKNLDKILTEAKKKKAKPERPPLTGYLN